MFELKQLSLAFKRILKEKNSRVTALQRQDRIFILPTPKEGILQRAARIMLNHERRFFHLRARGRGEVFLYRSNLLPFQNQQVTLHSILKKQSKDNRMGRIAARLRQDRKDAGETPATPKKNILHILPQLCCDPSYPVSFNKLRLCNL